MYNFIVNPHAHSGKGKIWWKKLERHLRRSAIDYRVFMTEETGDARRYAAELTKNSKQEEIVLVAVGGDGTVNEILDGINFCAKVTLGYLPIGTANDLAKSLRLPRNPMKCLKRIIHPRSFRMMDYGVVTCDGDTQNMNHRRFAVSCGIGFDAAVCCMLQEKRKSGAYPSLFGKQSYLICGIRQLIRTGPTRGYIVLDGTKKVEFNHIYFVSAHVHPYEGGGFKFAPDANDSDGMLDICVVHHAWKYKVVRVLAHALFGTDKHCKGMRVYRCKDACICLDRSMPVHADGELCGEYQMIHVGCLERKVRLMV